MKQAITVFALSLGLCAAPAFAEQAAGPTKQAVKMSDAQLDNVVAGQVMSVQTGAVNVSVGDVTVLQDVRILNNSVNGLTVQVPVAATVSAAVGVLGNAGAVAQQFGA